MPIAAKTAEANSSDDVMGVAEMRLSETTTNKDAKKKTIARTSTISDALTFSTFKSKI